MRLLEKRTEVEKGGHTSAPLRPQNVSSKLRSRLCDLTCSLFNSFIRVLTPGAGRAHGALPEAQPLREPVAGARLRT